MSARSSMCEACKQDTEHCVLEARPAPNGAIRRRRVCRGCGARWTTYEVPAWMFRGLRGRLLRLIADLATMGVTGSKPQGDSDVQGVPAWKIKNDAIGIQKRDAVRAGKEKA